MIKAVFLDRDGVINLDAREGEYILTPDEFIFQPHLFEALKPLAKRGYRFFVITNQRCIARGLLDQKGLAAVHDKMMKGFLQHGLAIDAIYVCEHEKNSCQCRKPEPGMILQAVSDFDVDLSFSYFVGNRETDLIAAKRAGVGAHILYAPKGLYQGATQPDYLITDLSELVDIIV